MGFGRFFFFFFCGFALPLLHVSIYKDQSSLEKFWILEFGTMDSRAVKDPASEQPACSLCHNTAVILTFLGSFT